MTYDVTVQQQPEQRAAVHRGQVPEDGIAEFMGRAFGAVLAAVGGESGVAGMPFARYDVTPDGFTVEAGFPVAGEVPPGGDVEMITLAGGDVATLMHVGRYEDLAGAYEALETWLQDHGYVPTGQPWESYLDGPDVERPRTIVSWPCRRV
jgi:effector-binding domain-containing protein